MTKSKYSKLATYDYSTYTSTKNLNVNRVYLGFTDLCKICHEGIYCTWNKKPKNSTPLFYILTKSWVKRQTYRLPFLSNDFF
jgi:hypothetical protein